MTRFRLVLWCSATAVAALVLLWCPFAYAQEIRQPEPVPLPPPIAAPRDVPYPGTIDLAVDVTDIQRRIVNVREKIPVQPGDITLL